MTDDQRPGTTCAVIVAAGSSQRMGFDKLMAPLGRKPVLQRSIDAFLACESISAVVLVGGPAILATAEGWKMAGGGKLTAVVPGGQMRHQSVRNGLAACPAGTTLAAVHDGARPLVTPGDITRVVMAAREHGAATLARPIPDTVKRVAEDGTVLDPVDRTGLWAMETPQVARMDWLVDALDAVTAVGGSVTDEVTALRDRGRPVQVVASTSLNPKITYPHDLDPARRLLGLPPEAPQVMVEPSA